MQWFEGSVHEAIAESQRKKVMFVVYIEDQSEDSQKMNATLSDPKVGSACSLGTCIAIKMNVGSQQCQQFSELYPLVCIPVLYFIGHQGLPLEVVGGVVSADELVNKASSAFESYKTSIENNGPKQTSTQDNNTGSSTVNAEHQNQPATSYGAGTANLEDRVQRAKQLIEETRKDKVEEEKEKEKEKEMKRRKQGKEILKAKQELDDRKAQMLQQKIKDDKAKERAHREEVRQQIARDKAEREARRQRELQERQNITAVVSERLTSSSAPASHANKREDSRSHSNARLQFRFPDGSSVTQTFPADSLLLVPYEFITSNPKAAMFTSGVTLLTTFPRRELTDEDMTKPLSELGLTPSSALIVMPKKQVTRSTQNSSVLDLVLWVLSPVLGLINFIKLLILGSPSQPRGTHRENSNPDRQTSQPTNSSDVRRRGVHRLSQLKDDNDDNNTWNGNSTQQQ